MSMRREGQGVRSDAKSCQECRRRKTRCTWSSRSGATTACNSCTARGLPCIPQQRRSAASAPIRKFARQRIEQLEKQLATLATLVQPEPRNPPGDSDPARLQPGLLRDNEDAPQLHNALESMTHVARPGHLRMLFEPLRIQGVRHEEADAENNEMLVDASVAARKINRELRKLLPSREEVNQIAQFASEWMVLYHAMFMVGFTFRTGDQLISNYDRMRGGDVSPVSLATYLLSIAITAEQTPPERRIPEFCSGRGTESFVTATCRAVEYLVINDNYLASTVEGLEAGLLFARLSLGRGDLHGTWLIVRRVLALAELVGLPRSHDRPGSRTLEERRHSQLKADIWESICATDRNFSMMLNVPAGTIRYPFPRDTVVYRNGNFLSRPYNYRLSNVCAAVFEIDESYLLDIDAAESYEKVVNADRQMRKLASEVPRTWWRDSSSDSSLDSLLVRFWHNYILARVHLIPATMDDADGHYAYSRSTCLTACREAVGLFPQLRSRVPSGFFVCRILDVQVFTAAAFLLVSSLQMHDMGQSADALTANNEHIERVITCLESVDGHAGSDLARESSKALRGLKEFVRGRMNERSGSITLEIPLLGQICVGIGQKAVGDELYINLGQGEQKIDPVARLDDDTMGLHEDPMADGTTTVASQAPLQWSFDFEDTSNWLFGVDEDNAWIEAS